MTDLLRLSRVSIGELTTRRVDLSRLAEDILSQLRSEAPERQVEQRIAPGIVAEGDAGLLRIVLENLLSNAWKYMAKCARAWIEFGARLESDCSLLFYVRDNGAGFDMKHAAQLFQPFRRLHRQEEFPGSGVGLATVQRIVSRHGGRIWAEAAPGQGAAFYFTLRA